MSVVAWMLDLSSSILKPLRAGALSFNFFFNFIYREDSRLGVKVK